MAGYARTSLLVGAILMAATGLARGQPAAPSAVAAARDAVAQAAQATGIENPAEAGASYARLTGPVSAPLPQPVNKLEAPGLQPDAAPQPVGIAQEVAALHASPPPETAGIWRVQLGTFSVPGNAARLWDKLQSRPELSGRERLIAPDGRFEVLYATRYPTQSAAQAACRALRQDRQDCLVTRD